ncbi:MAG: hypothetical protein V4482_03375 [Pseudomonadota bacterium]
MFKSALLNIVMLMLSCAMPVFSMDRHGDITESFLSVGSTSIQTHDVSQLHAESVSLLAPHVLSSPPIANTNADRDDDDSILPGDDDIPFATPCLEYYIGGSVMCWNGLSSVLEDMEILAEAASTGLAACTQFVGTDSTAKFVAYSIQAVLIANLFHKFYTLSEKLVVIQEKRKLTLKQQNQLDLKNNLDPHSVILINGVDAAQNKDVYATEVLANYYSCCAVSRNILVDQIGVLSLFCRCLAGSILNYSQILNANDRSGYLLMGTLFGVVATVSHAYTKILIAKTKDWEIKALNARGYVQYEKRMADVAGMV